MTVIVTKNSSTASAVPTTSDLVQGELAVNVTDKRIFTENASTQIVELGTNPSTITTGSATVTGTLTANGTFASNNAVITGGSINSTPIGATTPSTVRGSTVTATTGFVGGLTGNVTGNLTGNVTGNVVGNLTGNVTGNVTASTGTTTLNNLVVNGTADFTNTKLTNITTPTLDSDAANKGYVDATVAAVIDSAPAALDTLNELAAALGDDANFSATVTTALATKLPLAGGTMTGAIAMGTSKITGLGDPTASQDAATKIYVDTADNLKLNLSGGTMSGAIAMGTNKITGLGDPTLAQDAATKAYTDSILGSATSAAASAAAAATSESNAATSASNAATSETNALNSANAAASSYDQFDDRYLGDKASDPTLDNDGNALLTGALYFNTTTDVMRVYNGSAWQDTAISPNSPTFTGTVTADGLSLGDNDKATFGASNDLEIYHDGTHSWIKDVATGDLIIQGSNAIRLRSATGENMGLFNADGAVTLQHNNLTKFATTATGIDVTGTATMDGLTVDGDLAVASDLPIITLTDNNNSSSRTDIDYNFGYFQIDVDANAVDAAEAFRVAISGTKHFEVSTGGDISFYEDTGTTPKFFWDASAESLGIGTTSPNADLELGGTGEVVRLSGSSTNAYIRNTDGTTNQWYIGSGGNAGLQHYVYQAQPITFHTSGLERLRIDSSGNVGIGTSSPLSRLDVNTSASPLSISNGTTAIGEISYASSTSPNRALTVKGLDGIRFNDSVSERMRIDSSGNVGIGEAPNSNSKLQILDTAATANNYTVHMRSYQPTIVWNDISGASTDFAIQVDTSAMMFQYGDAGTGTKLASEAMRIDSSGNLLVGKTVIDSSVQGLVLSGQYNLAAFTRDQNPPLLLNRLTSDGMIAEFRKDGTTVGSIGVDNNDNLVIEGNSTHGGFQIATNVILPHKNGALIDNTIGFGNGDNRFTDLYLSGGVYLGGTVAANKLDDYEEGTWTPTFTNLTIGNGTQSHIYTKVGNKVTLEGTITLGSTSSISGALSDANVPFTANTTQRAYSKCYFLDNGTANYIGTAVVNDLSDLQLLTDIASSTYLNYGNVSSTVPFTWTSTDVIRYSITYIAA